MGLDISIGANNSRDLFRLEEVEQIILSDKYRLSRKFCNFMRRPAVTLGEPELDQIGRITGVDITPLYAMESYEMEEDVPVISSFCPFGEPEEEDWQSLAKAIKARQDLEGNINLVSLTVNNLIEKLEAIPDLPDLLLPTEDDTLNMEWYFADFKLDKDNGYGYNNFGHDLRNFRRFLEYAKSNGTTTVWFIYD